MYLGKEQEMKFVMTSSPDLKDELIQAIARVRAEEKTEEDKNKIVASYIAGKMNEDMTHGSLLEIADLYMTEREVQIAYEKIERLAE